MNAWLRFISSYHIWLQVPPLSVLRETFYSTSWNNNSLSVSKACWKIISEPQQEPRIKTSSNRANPALILLHLSVPFQSSCVSSMIHARPSKAPGCSAITELMGKKFWMLWCTTKLERGGSLQARDLSVPLVSLCDACFFHLWLSVTLGAGLWISEVQLWVLYELKVGGRLYGVVQDEGEGGNKRQTCLKAYCSVGQWKCFLCSTMFLYLII